MAAGLSIALRWQDGASRVRLRGLAVQGIQGGKENQAVKAELLRQTAHADWIGHDVTHRIKLPGGGCPFPQQSRGLRFGIAVKPAFVQHGFLPTQDPLRAFPHGSELAVLDELGHDLPSLLQDGGFRGHMCRLEIPPWPNEGFDESSEAELRLYYVRLGFLASAYINQVSTPWRRSCRET